MANNEKDLRDSANPQDRNENPGKAPNKTGRTGTSNRGFASMDQARHREISAMGGRASHESGRGHEFDSEEARIAGRKGGQASHGRKNATPENVTPNPDVEDTFENRTSRTQGNIDPDKGVTF